MGEPGMQAVQISRYGGPEVLELAERPRPVIERPTDCLVRIRASAINPVDYKLRRGYQRTVVPLRFPAVLGMDISGEIVAVGDAVDGFAVGDEVFSSPHHKRQGGYAQYAVVDAKELALKPKNLTHIEAASIPLVGLTAYRCLAQVTTVAEGEKVLIQAGAGGVGTFAIQLCKHLGATVATTCSARNEKFVRGLGADIVVDYNTTRFEDVLERQDVVLDAMGGTVKARALKILGRGGRLVCINSDLATNAARFGPLLGLVKSAFSLAWFGLRARLVHGVRAKNVVRHADGQALAHIASLLESGEIKPIIDRTFPLEAVADAHRYLEQGHARGKVVLEVGD